MRLALKSKIVNGMHITMTNLNEVYIGKKREKFDSREEAEERFENIK